jgi:membrane associated rhomboid family serine protease
LIPLRDDTPNSRVPIVTWLLIAACVLVFVAQQQQGEGELHGLVSDYAMVPARVLGDGGSVAFDVELPDRHGGLRREHVELGPAAVPEWLTLLTCMFLHGSWLHLIGNVWVLFIFGDNVEDRLGRIRYLLFYLLSGAAASAAHLFSAPESPVPTVGASGAIAGVMGGYLLLYPHARVLALLPIGFFLYMTVLPAAVFLLLWFGLQVLQGMIASDQDGMGGVAWWAHIGGFAVGLVAMALLRLLGALRPAPALARLQAHRLRWRRGVR